MILFLASNSFMQQFVSDNETASISSIPDNFPRRVRISSPIGGLAHLFHSSLQSLGSEVPILLVAHVVLGHGGDLDLIAQAEYGVNFVKEFDNVLDLVLHLIPGHEDVSIVLGEAADTEQTVESAGQLMTVDKTQFTHAQRQVTVGVGLACVVISS